MKKFLISLLTVVMVVGIIFTGCARGPAPALTPAIPPEPAGFPQPNPYWGLGFKPDGTAYKFTVITATLGCDWFIPAARVPESQLKMSGAEVYFYNAEFDLEQNIAIIEDSIEKGVDAIVQFPVEEAGTGPVVDKAGKAGIPDFSIDVDTDSEYVVHRTTYDQYSKGQIAGQIMVEVAESLGKQLNVYILHGMETYPINVVPRVEGFKDAIAGNPLITVTLGPDTKHMDEPAMNAIMDTFPAHPEFNAIYLTGGMYDGTKEALKALDRYYPIGHPDHVVLVAQDDFPCAVDMIRANYLDGCGINDPWAIGDSVAKAVLTYVCLGKPVPRLIQLEATPVTPENVDVSPYGGPMRWGDMLSQEPDVSKWPILDMERWGMPTPTYQQLLELQQ